MNQWVFSVIVCVLLTSIISIITPEGRLGQITKGIFSIIVMLVIIKPVINLTGDTEVPNGQFNVDSEISYDFIDYSNELKSSKLSKDCEQLLKIYGVDKANVKIEYSVDEKYTFLITKCSINLTKAVISLDKEHIVVNEEIKTLISSKLNIEKNKVFINE